MMFRALPRQPAASSVAADSSSAATPAAPAASADSDEAMFNWGEYVMRELPLHANGPPPCMLAVCDDSLTIPASRTRQIMPMAPGESDHKRAIHEAHKHYMLWMDNRKWVLQQDQRIAPASLTRCRSACRGYLA